MGLPVGFSFNQGSLQDFVDCRRRFQLRYILRQSWPAVESEPYIENERLVRQGQLFHHLAHQYLIGVPSTELAKLIHDPDLSRWWANFLEFAAHTLPFEETTGMKQYPEVLITIPVSKFRLLAKFDLLLILQNGRIKIYDWKTSRHRPKREWIIERLQTRIYPYILMKSGMLAESLDVEKVEMIYWFADFPNNPIVLNYNKARFLVDDEYVSGLIDLIDRLGEEDFFLTNDERVCRFCVYRSLCDRGAMAGNITEIDGMFDTAQLDEFLDVGLDFDQLSEIEY